jgi:AraC family transcriptional regulator
MRDFLINKPASIRTGIWPHVAFSLINDAPPQEIHHPALTNHHLLISKSYTPVQMTIRYGSEPFFEGSVKTGDIILLPAGSACTCRWEEDFSLLWMEVAPALLRGTADRCAELADAPVSLAVQAPFRDPKLLQIGSWLAEELNHAPGEAFMVESLTNILGVHLLRHHALHSAKPPLLPETLSHFPLTDVIGYMHAHLERDISLSELSRAANVSPPHLVRLFKRATGFAPHQYLIHLRVQRAKELLIRGGLSISEIAAQTGFADQSHLSRHFKRIVGCTPKSYLNQISF